MSLDRAPIVEQEGSTVPLVSVVIPTRRRAGLLSQCLGSILAQTVGDIEVIVVVDGPDPATIDLLSNIDDRRLRYATHPESRGVSNARNTGIEIATGRWLAFCDDDDTWAPTKLAAQLKALTKKPDARWVIAGEIRVKMDPPSASYSEPPVSEEVAAALPHTNVVPGGCSGVMADRSLIVDLGGFDPQLSMLADRDLWIRLNWNSAVAVAAEPLIGYRDHDGAMTRRLRSVEQELEVIRAKYSERLRRSGRPFPSDRFYIWAYRRTFSAGDWRGGLDLMIHSPRFRAAVTKWMWGRATRRVGRARAGAEHRQPDRVVTVAEFPWLDTILGPVRGSHTDALQREHEQPRTGRDVGKDPPMPSPPRGANG